MVGHGGGVGHTGRTERGSAYRRIPSGERVSEECAVKTYRSKDGNADLEEGCRLIGKVRFGPGCYVCSGARLEALGRSSILLGRDVFIGANSTLRADDSDVVLNDGVIVSSGCHINNLHTPGLPSTGPVTIGKQTVLDPNVIIGNNVNIGERNYLGPGTRLEFYVRMGDRNRLTGCFIGLDPQDDAFYDELDAVYQDREPGVTKDTWVHIGSRNRIREGVRISRGTTKNPQEDRPTVIGNRNLIMDNTHLGHDSVVGDYVRITTGCKIGGHVRLDDWCVLAGSVKVNPFVHIGNCSYVTGNSGVDQDVLPYFKARGIDKGGELARMTPLANFRRINKMLRLTHANYDEQETTRLNLALGRMSEHIRGTATLDQLLEEFPGFDMVARWVEFKLKSQEKQRPVASEDDDALDHRIVPF